MSATADAAPAPITRPEPVGCFLPLLSPWVHTAVVDVVAAAGFRPLGRATFAEQVPDFVLVDHQTRKEDFLKAGFWRGYGVPVVVIGRRGAERRALARQMGFYALPDPDAFLAWFGTRPP